MSELQLERLTNTPFLIDDFVVDAQRNCITYNEIEHSVEPKAMQVLLHLAVNNGQVVSQETLFNQVWPNAVFSPGSVRRCIAILRKVLCQQNAKLIQTFPKKGYELTAKIEIITTTKKNRTSRFSQFGLAIFPILLGLFIFFNYFSDTNSKTPIKSYQITPVTATEALEFNAKVSANGELIAFLRIEPNTEIRTLWLKNLSTEQEQQLTKQSVLEFDWSPNSEELIYITNAAQQQRIHQLNIKRSEPIQFIASIAPEKRISSIHWGSDNKLYLLAKNEGNVVLIAYDIDTGIASTKLSFTSAFSPYELSLHKQKHVLALVGFNQQGLSQIAIHDLNINSSFSGPTITLNKNRYFLNWHSNGESLITSDGRTLNQVTLDGHIIPYGYNSFDFVQYPQFVPNTNSILFSLGKIDLDIELISSTDSNQVTKLIDSNTVDREASLSPDKSKVAFISHRKGYPQIYLLNLASGKLQLIYENTEQLLGVSKPVWDKDGKRLGFSNYDFPFITQFTENEFSTEALKNYKGVFSDFYGNHTQALLFNRRLNQFETIELAAQQPQYSISKFKENTFIDANDQICFIQQQTLFCRQDEQDVENLILNKNIIGFEKSGSELLITAQENQRKWLIVVDWQSKEIKRQIEIPNHIHKVLAVIDDQIMYSTVRQQKDIVLLK